MSIRFGDPAQHRAIEDAGVAVCLAEAVTSSYVQRPFPSKENLRISERDDLGPPFVPGGQEIGVGSRNLERADR
jgi:hypothetical protein